MSYDLFLLGHEFDPTTSGDWTAAPVWRGELREAVDRELTGSGFALAVTSDALKDTEQHLVQA